MLSVWIIKRQRASIMSSQASRVHNHTKEEKRSTVGTTTPTRVVSDTIADGRRQNVTVRASVTY